MRVKYEEMVSEFKRVLEKYGFDGKRAEEAAEIFAQNSLAGVYSHGLNRFQEWLNISGKERLIKGSCRMYLPVWGL